MVVGVNLGVFLFYDDMRDARTRAYYVFMSLLYHPGVVGVGPVVHDGDPDPCCNRMHDTTELLGGNWCFYWSRLYTW